MSLDLNQTLSSAFTVWFVRLMQVMTSLNVTLLAAACARLVFSEVDGRASH
jgi:hypothetical protein